MVNSQVTVELPKMVFAEQPLKTVMLEDKSNWAKLNATNANHAQLDKISLATTAKSQDQPVIAINNTTKPPTNALTAQPDNSLETVVLLKTAFAELLLRTVMLVVKFNSHKLNAINAKPAQLDKTSLVTLAESQDQFAHASNNTTLRPTNALTVLLDNFPEMEVPLKTVFAELITRTVMLEDKSNCLSNNAINAKHAQPVKSSEVTINALFQDQHADATKLLTHKLTNANNVELDN